MVPSCAAANEGGDTLDAAVAASSTQPVCNEAAPTAPVVDEKLLAIRSGLAAAEELLAQRTWARRDVEDIVSELWAANVKGLNAPTLALKVAKARAKAAGRDPKYVKSKNTRSFDVDEWLPALIAELKNRETNFATIRAAENARDAEAEANAEAVDDVFALGGELWTPREEAVVDDDVRVGPAF